MPPERCRRPKPDTGGALLLLFSSLRCGGGGSASLSLVVEDAMIFATALTITGFAIVCWLVLTLAVYALPFFAGLSAALFAYQHDAGQIGAVVVGLMAGALTLALGQSGLRQRPSSRRARPDRGGLCRACGPRRLRPRAPSERDRRRVRAVADRVCRGRSIGRRGSGLGPDQRLRYEWSRSEHLGTAIPRLCRGRSQREVNRRIAGHGTGGQRGGWNVGRPMRRGGLCALAQRRTLRRERPIWS